MTTEQKIQQQILTTAYHNYEKRLSVHAFYKVHDHAVWQVPQKLDT